MDYSNTTTTSKESSRPLLEDRDIPLANDNDDDNDCCELHSTTCCDNLILWLVLPTLLFVQFAIAFRLEQQHDVHTNNLEWSTVNYSIVLFVLSSYLFRRTLQETVSCKHASYAATFLFLLPEIIMDVLLALVLFGQVVPAFLAMVFCTMGLSFYVVLQSFQTLLWGETEMVVEEKVQQEEEAV